MQVFTDYLDNVSKFDYFQGFQILYKLHNLQNVFGVFICETEYRTKVFGNGAPFIGIRNEMKIIPESEYLRTQKWSWSYDF